MVRTCEVCGKEFNTRPAYVRRGGGRFCSRACFATHRRNGRPSKDPEYRRAWRKAHKEEIAAYYQQYYKRRHQYHLERTRLYRETHSEQVREAARKWRRAHPEKSVEYEQRRRTRKAMAGGDFTAEEFRALCDRLGNRCLACGAKGSLEADHIIPLSKGGISDISNIQPLCGFCNKSKRDKTIDYRPEVCEKALRGVEVSW